MFAYLLILAELSLLATVFWYVFVREPRPIEIRDNLWGCYDKSLDAITGYSINDQLHAASEDNEEPRRSRKVRRSVHQIVLLRSSRHGVKRKNVNVSFDLKNGWVELNPTRPSGFIASALSGIAEKLNQLSIRLS